MSRPSNESNDAEREKQVDEIIKRAERLEAEAARLRQLAKQVAEANRKTVTSE